MVGRGERGRALHKLQVMYVGISGERTACRCSGVGVVRKRLRRRKTSVKFIGLRSTRNEKYYNVILLLCGEMETGASCVTGKYNIMFAKLLRRRRL